MLRIVCDYGVRDSETAYYRFPDEIVDILGSDASQRYGFYPLGEIVDCDYWVLETSDSGGQWTNYVNSPLGERPGN